jgi:MerR family copper efflux transcriptional regulator
MRISEVAKSAGVGVETIRFYERKGLVKQPIRPADSGFRTYPPEVVSRIRFVREAQELGFSLREIEDLLSLKADPHTDCSSVRNRALKKRDEVNAKIKRLKALQRTLTTLIAACPGKGVTSYCSILDALEQGNNSGQKRKSTNSSER